MLYDIELRFVERDSELSGFPPRGVLQYNKLQVKNLPEGEFIAWGGWEDVPIVKEG